MISDDGPLSLVYAWQSPYCFTSIEKRILSDELVNILSATGHNCKAWRHFVGFTSSTMYCHVPNLCSMW